MATASGFYVSGKKIDILALSAKNSEKLGGQAPSYYATSAVSAAISAKQDKLTTAQMSAISSVSGKVDKVSGKGLSTNDYTTTEMNKLAGIAAGAEVNVQSDWNQTVSTQDDYIKNKPDMSSYATTTWVEEKISEYEASFLTKRNSSIFETEAELKQAAATDFYLRGEQHTPNKNDWTIVRHGEEISGIKYSSRYMYDGRSPYSSDGWIFEVSYKMTLSDAQLAALNSGITRASYDGTANNAIHDDAGNTITATYVKKNQIVQTTGTSTANVMSQKAVTDAIDNVDNRLDNVAAALDQQILNVDTDLHTEIERSIAEDANLGTAIQNLGAVKQDKLTGTIGSNNIPIYLNNGTLTASDLNIARVRAISHNNVLAPNGLLITLPNTNSYGHGSLIVNGAYNGYPFQIMVGFAHTAADGIYRIQAKVHSNNNNASDSYVPIISYYTAANETCYIHLLWGNITERLRTTISCNNYDKVIISTAQKPSGVTFTTLAASQIAGLVSVATYNANLGSNSTPVYYDGVGKLQACTAVNAHTVDNYHIVVTGSKPTSFAANTIYFIGM